MPRRGSRFVLDNNLVIAAVKSGWTKSTNLLMTLLLSDADIFVNDELLLEYERYIHRVLGGFLFTYVCEAVSGGWLKFRPDGVQFP